MNVISSGGYYRLINETNGRISVIFDAQEDNLSVGPHVLCKKCYRRIEKYEATIKEQTGKISV